MTSLFIRSIKFIIGGGIVFVLLLAMYGTISDWVTNPPKQTAEQAIHKHPHPIKLASDGPMGKFDKRQLQRGLKVYQEVCSACHSLHNVSFRDFKALGYNDAQVKALAKAWAVKQPQFDEKGGTWGERDNLASDRLPKVYYAGTGSPPDLSLIAKARHGGASYVHALLLGYDEKPTAKQIKKFPEFAAPPEGMYFNPYFANLNIAMPPPLNADGQVKYDDGTVATKDQMAKDVAAFLVWTAEPTLETRHTAGLAVLLFLLIATGLGYGAYLTVWRGVKH